MNAYRRLTVFLLLLMPLASTAEELNLGVDLLGVYDTNARAGSAGGEEDDLRFRFNPYVRVKEDRGDFTWDLTYNPSYDYSVESSERRYWTHQALGHLSWQFHPTTRLDLSDRFGRFESTGRFNEAVTQEIGEEVVDVSRSGDRSDWNTRNSFSASLSHQLSSTQTTFIDIGHNLVDYSSSEQSDRESFGATGRYEQIVSTRNRLGGGVSYRRASVDGGSIGGVDRGSQSTDFYNAFASWRYVFDETFQLSVAAGPTWVKAGEPDNFDVVAQDVLQYPLLNVEGQSQFVEARSCPKLDDGTPYLGAGCDSIDEDLTIAEVNAVLNARTDLALIGSIPSGSDETVTYFANVSMSKRWDRWSGSLSYRRQQSDTSGIGSSTIADIVTGALSWQMSKRWKADLNVSWTRQSQATEPVRRVVAVRPVDVSFEVDGIAGRTFRGVAESYALRAVKVDQDFSVDTLWISLGFNYNVARRTTLFSRAFYWKRSSKPDVGRDYDSFRIQFGVTYDFDPIRI